MVKRRLFLTFCMHLPVLVEAAGVLKSRVSPLPVYLRPLFFSFTGSTEVRAENNVTFS